jgi:hypothetical protein
MRLSFVGSVQSKVTLSVEQERKTPKRVGGGFHFTDIDVVVRDFRRGGGASFPRSRRKKSPASTFAKRGARSDSPSYTGTQEGMEGGSGHPPQLGLGQGLLQIRVVRPVRRPKEL